jgi:hypothetical protein
MPHYQQLLFGCANPRAGLAERNPITEVEMLWDWISHLAATTRIPLDWPADMIVIAPLESDQTAENDILGVVIAVSDEAARHHAHAVAPLYSLLPKQAGPSALAELCLPVSADIQTAMLRWEIARFSAREIGMDLPPGRLFLVEGWFDLEEGATAEPTAVSAPAVGATESWDEPGRCSENSATS